MVPEYRGAADSLLRERSGDAGEGELRLLDLFCGRWGWSRAFAARGWECTGIDLVEPPEIPERCHFIQRDILTLGTELSYSLFMGCFDFLVASSPCEQFAVHCMKFTKKKDHPFPALGIQLFRHTRTLCEASGLPFVMENVRCAEQFVGRAQAHAGSFYLWGTAVPPLLPKRLIKMGNQGGYTKRGVFVHDPPGRRQPAHKSATIPPELANCVAEYAERLLEQKAVSA
jgi:hypothetical protein